MLISAAELVAAIGQVCNLPASPIIHQHLSLDCSTSIVLRRAYDADNVSRAPPLIVRFVILIPSSVFFCLDYQ
jgi:hypothetical protein